MESMNRLQYRDFLLKKDSNEGLNVARYMPNNPSPYSPDYWLFEYAGKAFNVVCDKGLTIFSIEHGDMIGIRVKNKSYKDDFFHSDYIPSPLDPDDIKRYLKICSN